MLQLSEKQQKAIDLLTDDTTKQLGYGGGAGGGKTYLGSYYGLLIGSYLVGSKGFIGRDVLKDTRESVLHTWRKVARELNLTNWRYSENHIYFKNGSEIEFLDLSYMPNKDPQYDRFGSKEYTWGWIEEAAGVNSRAFEVLDTRIGRWYNKEYGMPGKMLVTFNPRRNWLYDTFYLPFKTNTETEKTKFIPALYKDNPHLPSEYVERLHAIKDKATRERLLNGNFDYDDDPTALIPFDVILAIWVNDHIQKTGEMYLTADIARFGSDSAIIMVWNGLVIIDYMEYEKSDTVLLQKTILSFRIKYNIPKHQCIADEDGIGGGVVDNTGIIGFQNGGASVDKAYYRLKDECGYLLAEKIKSIWFEAPVPQAVKNKIENELAQLKTFDADKDGKLRILPKAIIKENIGHSPDWMDNFIMRMYFFIHNPTYYNEVYEKAKKLLKI